MLAGVGGIDLVLLVVAADESVMPQTREHFDICRLLHVPAGVDRADQVRSRRRAKRSSWRRSKCASWSPDRFSSDAPLVPVSARTGEGLDELRAGASSGSGLGGEGPVRRRPRAPADRSRLLDQRIRHRRDRHAGVRPHSRRRSAGGPAVRSAGRPVSRARRPGARQPERGGGRRPARGRQPGESRSRRS